MDELIVRRFPVSPYEPFWQGMKTFTDNRTDTTLDELWLLEHDPVFTQGQAGKAEHLLQPSGIPVVQTDRGGQVTYHGPGQLMGYLLVDLKRRKLGVRDLVTMIEETIVAVLGHFGVNGVADPDAPGVYVEGAKIASLGLRVRRGCSYHGFALNITTDLAPFAEINPCGYPGLNMVRLVDLTQGVNRDSVEAQVVAELVRRLGYNGTIESTPEIPS